MARGRRGRPASGVVSDTRRGIRSRVVPVRNEEQVRRRSSSHQSRRSHHGHSSSRVRGSSDSGHSPSPSRNSTHERSRPESRSPGPSSEPPAWAKDILKALEDKTQEVKVVKEQLASLKRKSSEDEPELKYKGNRKQFKFNKDVREKFEQILEKAGANDALAKIANRRYVND